MWEQVSMLIEQTTPLDAFHFDRFRTALRELLGNDTSEPNTLPLLTYLLQTPTTQHGITLLYKLFKPQNDPIKAKFQRDWEEELEMEVTTHYGPGASVRLYRYGLRGTDNCLRCDAPNAHFLHLAWDCAGIRNFWREVIGVVNTMLGCDISETPLVAILGYDKLIPKGVRKLTATGLMLAKRRVAMRWMKAPLPTLAEWKTDLEYCSTQSEAYNELMPLRCAPKDIWGPYRT